jgi:L-ascorbate metabolism protein UlaG (beta-lactamase superfamily)
MELINPRYVIPEHYATFPVLTQSADEFIKEVRHYAPKTNAMAIKPGEEIII